MIHHLSSQLLQPSAVYRRVFSNYVEGLETRLINASSVALNYSHQVLEERWISSTPLVVKEKMNYHDSRTANLQTITSNPVSLLSKLDMRFQLSWGDLIIMSLIMIMLRFTLHSFQLNLTLNLFQIQTPLRSNQLRIKKCTISCNSSIHNMMMIFWMLISIFFSIYWWYPLLQNFI